MMPIVPRQRRICMVMTTRGNHAKLRSTLRHLAAHPDATPQVVIGGALLDPSYSDISALIAADGFSVDARLDYIVPGTTLSSVTESSGRCIYEMNRILEALRPDWLVVVADRYESLAIAQAGLCRNVRMAHLEGGEVSGSIDERIRHAVTKLAHLHFPANEDAAERLRRLGEPDDAIHIVGTPSLDVLTETNLTDTDPVSVRIAEHGSGRSVNLAADFIVVSQHSVVTEYDRAPRQFAVTCDAVRALGLPVVWILPNDDAGANEAYAPVRALIADPAAPPVCSLGGLNFPEYATLLKNAQVLIGNSSSGIRESAFLGVPSVNIGTRQNRRQRHSVNVIHVDHDVKAIVEASQAQIAHGPYPSDPIFGDGHAGERIAAVLMAAWPCLDKTITY